MNYNSFYREVLSSTKGHTGSAMYIPKRSMVIKNKRRNKKK